MSGRDERRARADFAARYALPSSDAQGQVERAVIGAVWGANGYTTVSQADEIGQRLGLGPGTLLLDVGTGRGWPGVYLAARHGCAVVATDMPVEGLAVARRKAQREQVADRVMVVAAAGSEQPFRAAAFDAVVHTDVLC